MASSETSQLSLENLSFGLVMANGQWEFPSSQSCECNALLRNLPVYSGQYETGGKVVILYALRSLFSTFHLSGFTWPVTRHQRPVHP